MNYSVRKLFTGLARAPLIAVYPTVIQAISTEPPMVTRKNQAPKPINAVSLICLGRCRLLY
jgi:hypothetical protein